MLRILPVVIILFCTAVLAEDIDALKKIIEDRASAALPDSLGKQAPNEKLVSDAAAVVETAGKIIADGSASEKDKRWALQRQAVSLIILAYADITRYYTPLIRVEEELTKQGLKKLAALVEKHILLIGSVIAVQTKTAEDGSDKGIQLDALVSRMMLFAQANPGPEAERVLDLFLTQIRTLPPTPRDKRLANVAPVFQRHYQEINHHAKAAALQSDIDRSTLPGKPMALIGVDIDGNDFDINTIKDKAVIVQFWGTWCPHCKEEMNELVRLYDKYHSKGLEIIGVNTAVKGDEKAETVKKFLQMHSFGGKKVPYTILHEGLAERKYQLSMTKQYGIDELPVLVLIGRNGKVLKLHPLPSTLDSLVEEAVSVANAVEFTPEEKAKIEEAKKLRDEEEKRKIEEELKR
ncbi:MAG: TlpA family protein disulfide reductase [Planctomycetaceae bacterium]|jgi:thiol-disulfide isomerase/thioredoxin|nr:TlpA family protein disulfide reductase [Planctomycetaceae bacterium]